MSPSIHLDSYHDDSRGRQINHDVGVLKVGPPRRFLFRYREDGCDTELAIDEKPDGTFHAVFTYPPNHEQRDLAIAAIGQTAAGEWEVDVSGMYHGKLYDFTIHAAPRVPELPSQTPGTRRGEP
jgi:hypothetical protein